MRDEWTAVIWRAPRTSSKGYHGLKHGSAQVATHRKTDQNVPPKHRIMNRTLKPIFEQFVSILGLSLLAACATTPPQHIPAARAPAMLLDLPPMKVFQEASPGQHPRQTPRSNTALARDFLDLSFALENGTPLAHLTRFEGPITLRVIGAHVPASLGPDLGQLLRRLEREAGVRITRVPSANAAASVTIQTLPLTELAHRAPNTACIVAPNVSNWREFKRERRKNLSWTQVETRTRLAIFIPEEVAPQEIRDCLHEELAQALGPLNDLYRLSDSVFNDDNIHSVLTPFDMLMLKLTYAPDLHSGMTRAEVAARLPALLKRVHPSGEIPDTSQPSPTPRLWTDLVIAAMSEGSIPARKSAAESAVAIARTEGWDDTRTGFSWFLLGRLALSSDQALAHTALTESARIYGAHPETRFHAAHVALQLSALALVEGQDQTAYEIAARAIPAAKDAENAALLASLMMTEAEALAAMGHVNDARSVRLDSLGWARYGFGADAMVRSRAAEIAALTP